MMRVIVTIEPGGDASRAREIAEIEIWNRSELADVSDYGWEARLEGGKRYTGEVRGHQRSHGWAPLVDRALLDMRAAQSAERVFPKEFVAAPWVRERGTHEAVLTKIEDVRAAVIDAFPTIAVDHLDELKAMLTGGAADGK